MATGSLLPEPSTSPGDAYLHRIGRELLRMHVYADELAHRITGHERLLVDALAARNLDRLDLPDLSIRRVGRTGIAVG